MIPVISPKKIKNVEKNYLINFKNKEILQKRAVKGIAKIILKKKKDPVKDKKILFLKIFLCFSNFIPSNFQACLNEPTIDCKKNEYKVCPLLAVAGSFEVATLT